MSTASALKRRQWGIVMLLFAIAFLNYFDRQTLSVLKPLLKGELGLTDSGYSVLVTCFMAPYIVMYLASGPLVERLGNRATMSVFVSLWSLATLATGFTRTLFQLGTCRFFLGFAEPVSFPTGLRVYATWFAPKLRGFVSGMCTTGSALGAMLAPPLIAYMAVHFGWRMALIVPGLVGLVVAAIWWCFYRDPRIDEPNHAPATVRLDGRTWLGLFRQRAVLGIVLAGFISTPVWMFYLFWLPGYLQENLGLTLQQAGWVGWIPFLVADLGGVAAGLYSDRLIRRGVPPARARLRLMGISAGFAPLGILAAYAPNVASALVVFSIVALICQTWFVCNGPLVTELFPGWCVASVQGIYGACGAAGGLLINAMAGPIVERFGYGPVFVITGGLHLTAFGVLIVLCGPAVRARDGAQAVER